MKDIPLAVVIATKNRPREIEQYALASLERSDFRDFLCVVWDASDGDATQRIAEGGEWGFPLACVRAPRSGLPSQRNDAVEYVLEHHPCARCFLFIDDDTELSGDALSGLMESFEDERVWGVNVPHVPRLPWTSAAGATPSPGAGVRIVTPCLYNRSVCPEPPGISVDWLSGCGMAFRREVFEELGLRFPEAFQRFGGYALGEDVAASFYLKRKLGKELRNALSGALRHHAAGGARLNVAGMVASKWYNFHLLFEAIYEGGAGPILKLKFKLFMIAAALKALARARSLDLPSLIRGIGEARRGLKEYHEKDDVRNLFRSHKTGPIEPNLNKGVHEHV